MTNTPRLSRSDIEYLTHVWNFYSGCRHKQQGICPPGFKCWAEQMVNRHKEYYPNGFEPTFYPEAFLSPLSIRKPARIGVAFMGDLFGEWVNEYQFYEFWEDEEGIKPSVGQPFLMPARDARDIVTSVINRCPRHTFLFLTKAYWNLRKWSPFPGNAWVGATACTRGMMLEACRYLQGIEAGGKWLSVEPMLDDCWVLPSTLSLAGIRWLVIGAQRSPKKIPDWGWVEDIIEVADKLGIPVFLKNNLGLPAVSCEGAMPFYKKDPSGAIVLRQELPVGAGEACRTESART